jgi:hypothetical protein
MLAEPTAAELVHSLRSDHRTLYQQSPKFSIFDALRIVWSYYTTLAQMEKPGEFPVITSEELFSSYHTMLKGAPPLPPEDEVESSRVHPLRLS